MEICNKYIFVATRTPISLYQLSSKYSTKLINHLQTNLSHTKYFYLHRLKFINELELNLAKCLFNENDEYVYKLSHIELWTNLKTLKIIEVINDVADCMELQQDLRNIKFQNLQRIDINDMYNIYPLDVFRDSPSLEFIIVAWDDKNIHTLPKGIRGFAVCYGDSIQTKIPQTIQSMHLPTYTQLSHQEQKYKELKEICIRFPDQAELDWINKQSFNDLKRIHYKGFDPNYFQNQTYANSISSMFATANVNYIGIEGTTKCLRQMIKSLCNALQTGYRNSIKIRIILSATHHNSIIHDIYCLIKVLVNHTSHFMIIGESINQIEFDSKYYEKFVIKSNIQNESTYKFVISNKGCKINGYHEKWLMECARCQQHYQ